MTTSEPPEGSSAPAGTPPSDQVPDHVRAAALGAFVARDPAARVLELTSDDDLQQGRRLCFQAGGAVVEVVVVAGLDDPAARGVRVQVDPRPERGPDLELPGGPALVLERQGDAYVLARLPQGPVALAVDVEGQRYRTAWAVW